MSDGLETFERAARRIHDLATDVRHVERPLKEAGEYVIGSVTRNFLSGGRPSKWKQLAASTIAQRRRGKGKGGIKILINMGHLKNIQKKVTTDGVRVGTNVIYGARQHFGYKGGTGRGHSATPARPFMMLQSEDPPAIAKIFGRHLARR